MKGVSYCYFTCNMVKLNGEKWVRESFDSIKNQSDDILVVDYSSDDNIKEIADEYDFRFFTVDKVEGLPFHDAKLWNKGIYEAKYDLIVPISPDCIYDENLTEFILEWYGYYGHKKYLLTSYYIKQLPNKRLSGVSGVMAVYYRPYLLKARGCDERTYIRGGPNRGTHRYSLRIMMEVFGLKQFWVVMKSFHRYHKFRSPGLSKVSFDKFLGKFTTTSMIRPMKENFNEAVKDVVNSYW